MKGIKDIKITLLEEEYNRLNEAKNQIHLTWKEIIYKGLGLKYKE